MVGSLLLVPLVLQLWANPPSFSGNVAFQYLEDLVARGHRHYGAKNRQQQIDYMKKMLSDSGWKVSVQHFDELEQQSQNIYRLSNIIAQDPHPYKRRILLGSHWDTRLWAEEDPNILRRNHPIMGANDGSSGVALLFAIAAYLKENPLKNTAVDIVLCDGEEFGRPKKGGYCKGSEYFVQHLDRLYTSPLAAVIILDMIADAELTLEKEAHSIRYSPSLWSEVKQHLKKQDISFSQYSRSIRDDQSPFFDKNIPSILLIDLSYPYWHTHQDTLDKCSPKSMEKVGKGLLSWLRAIDSSTGPSQ